MRAARHACASIVEVKVESILHKAEGNNGVSAQGVLHQDISIGRHDGLDTICLVWVQPCGHSPEVVELSKHHLDWVHKMGWAIGCTSWALGRVTSQLKLLLLNDLGKVDTVVACVVAGLNLAAHQRAAIHKEVIGVTTLVVTKDVITEVFLVPLSRKVVRRGVVDVHAYSVTLVDQADQLPGAGPRSCLLVDEHQHIGADGVLGITRDNSAPVNHTSDSTRAKEHSVLGVHVLVLVEMVDGVHHVVLITGVVIHQEHRVSVFIRWMWAAPLQVVRVSDKEVLVQIHSGSVVGHDSVTLLESIRWHLIVVVHADLDVTFVAPVLSIPHVNAHRSKSGRNIEQWEHLSVVKSNLEPLRGRKVGTVDGDKGTA
mmetsp:Transcript_27419/g.33309  ORF Transcript_27419/g.33309 Transcript_27419/m.33309 type:complete len:370 (+) Transcript_27419:4748-5857(+)